MQAFGTLSDTASCTHDLTSSGCVTLILAVIPNQEAMCYTINSSATFYIITDIDLKVQSDKLQLGGCITALSIKPANENFPLFSPCTNFGNVDAEKHMENYRNGIHADVLVLLGHRFHLVSCWRRCSTFDDDVIFPGFFRSLVSSVNGNIILHRVNSSRWYLRLRV